MLYSFLTTWLLQSPRERVWDRWLEELAARAPPRLREQILRVRQNYNMPVFDWDYKGAKWTADS